MPANAKLVKQADKEASAFFTVNPTFNRTAYIAGTNENELRYYVTLSAAKPAAVAPVQRREVFSK